MVWLFQLLAAVGLDLRLERKDQIIYCPVPIAVGKKPYGLNSFLFFLTFSDNFKVGDEPIIFPLCTLAEISKSALLQNQPFLAG